MNGKFDFRSTACRQTNEMLYRGIHSKETVTLMYKSKHRQETFQQRPKLREQMQGTTTLTSRIFQLTMECRSIGKAQGFPKDGQSDTTTTTNCSQIRMGGILLQSYAKKSQLAGPNT